MPYYYCLCQTATEDISNVYTEAVISEEFPDCFEKATVCLTKPMTCIKTGAKQVWDHNGQEKLPHVDLYRCKDCGSELAVEKP